VRVFFDSNVFLHHLAETRKSATELLEKVESGEIDGYINDVVVSEVVYGYLRASSGLRPYELRAAIAKLDLNLDLFKVLPCSFGVKVAEVIEEYKLLPNDALIAATCKHYGIKKIATFDEDFRRVDFLEIVEI
jgi:hypothetical protein